MNKAEYYDRYGDDFHDYDLEPVCPACDCSDCPLQMCVYDNEASLTVKRMLWQQLAARPTQGAV